MLEEREGWLEYFLMYFPNPRSTVLWNEYIYFDKEVASCNGQSLVAYHVYEIVVGFLCACLNSVLPLVKCSTVAGVV